MLSSSYWQILLSLKNVVLHVCTYKVFCAINLRPENLKKLFMWKTGALSVPAPILVTPLIFMYFLFTYF